MGILVWCFPKDNVINFARLEDDNSKEVIKAATWFELDKIELQD